MQQRHFIAVLAVTVLLFGVAGGVDAAPAKKGEHKPPVHENVLTPDQEALHRTIMDESEKRLEPLKEQMYAKRLELKALAQNPNTPRETITALTQEMATLKTQIGNEKRTRNERIKKEVGIMKPQRGEQKQGNHEGCACEHKKSAE